MKKLFLILISFFTLLHLTGCEKEDPNKVLTYTEFMERDAGDVVTIEGFIAAKQIWNENSTSLYLATENTAEGFFVYRFPCSEKEYSYKYSTGSLLRIKATKSIVSGEHEIQGEDILESNIIVTSKSMNTTPVDLNSKLDSLWSYQNSFATLTMDVKSVKFKGEMGTDDIYLTLTNGTVDVSCVVEVNLTPIDSKTYKTGLSLADKIGSSVTIECYLYWWVPIEHINEAKEMGANPHITKITINE